LSDSVFSVVLPAAPQPANSAVAPTSDKAHFMLFFCFILLFLRLLFMDYPKSDNDSHSPNRNDYVLKDN
jgi:hypothetical protein